MEPSVLEYKAALKGIDQSIGKNCPLYKEILERLIARSIVDKNTGAEGYYKKILKTLI